MKFSEDFCFCKTKLEWFPPGLCKNSVVKHNFKWNTVVMGGGSDFNRHIYSWKCCLVGSMCCSKHEAMCKLWSPAFPCWPNVVRHSATKCSLTYLFEPFSHSLFPEMPVLLGLSSERCKNRLSTITYLFFLKKFGSTLLHKNKSRLALLHNLFFFLFFFGGEIL